MLALSFPKGNGQEEPRVLTQKPVYSPVTSVCGSESSSDIITWLCETALRLCIVDSFFEDLLV